MSEKWKFKKVGDFYKDLAMKESTDNQHKIQEKFKYIGLYQMGETALVDAGYYKKLPKPGQKPGSQYNNDWTGEWTGKNGITSRDKFFANRDAQDIAVKEYHNILWDNYLKDHHKYVGQAINGVELTKPGMIAAGHLVGHTSLKDFIKGVLDKEDGNGVTCSEYLSGFGSHMKDDVATKYSIDTSFTQDHINNAITGSGIDVSKLSLQSKPYTMQDMHDVKPGDTLSGIAKDHSMTTNELLNVPGNEQLKTHPDKIGIGDKVELGVPQSITTESDSKLTKPDFLGISKSHTLSEKFGSPMFSDSLKNRPHVDLDINKPIDPKVYDFKPLESLPKPPIETHILDSLSKRDEPLTPFKPFTPLTLPMPSTLLDPIGNDPFKFGSKYLSSAQKVGSQNADVENSEVLIDNVTLNIID